MSVVNEKTLFKYNRWKQAEEDDKSVLLPTYLLRQKTKTKQKYPYLCQP